jgi:hypothetical protein
MVALLEKLDLIEFLAETHGRDIFIAGRQHWLAVQPAKNLN